MTADMTKPPSVPPRWFVRTAWVVHRAIYRLTFGRIGLWPPKPNRWGTMRLTTVGRRSRERVAILGYYEDGPKLVTMAMNGWSDGEPAWWLNLQAQPDATAVLADGTRPVRGRAAVGDERARLWARWRDMATTSTPTRSCDPPRPPSWCLSRERDGTSRRTGRVAP